MMSLVMIVMSSIGILTTFSAIGFGLYKSFSYIKQKKNPVKVYIRSVVYEYLKELQND